VTKEHAIDAYATVNLYCVTHRSGATSIAPSRSKASHQFCGGNFGRGPLRATMGTCPELVVDGNSHNADSGSTNRQFMDQETLPKLVNVPFDELMWRLTLRGARKPFAEKGVKWTP
jgi:hypothetical protein